MNDSRRFGQEDLERYFCPECYLAAMRMTDLVPIGSERWKCMNCGFTDYRTMEDSTIGAIEGPPLNNTEI